MLISLGEELIMKIQRLNSNQKFTSMVKPKKEAKKKTPLTINDTIDISTPPDSSDFVITREVTDTEVIPVVIDRPKHKRAKVPISIHLDEEPSLSILSGGDKSSNVEGKKRFPHIITDFNANFKDDFLLVTGSEIGGYTTQTIREMQEAPNVYEAKMMSDVNPRNARVIEKSLDILKGNKTSIGDHTFTTPSKVVESDSHLDYEGKQWLWDSAFHAMILAKTDPAMARMELRSVMANQHPDGFVPHMNYFRGDAQKVPDWAKTHFENYLKAPENIGLSDDFKAKFANTYWSNPDHSNITQPPIVAESVEEVVNTTNDLDFAKEMIPGLKKYYDYLHDKRDPDGDNLISIVHPWESGWDNSQRWDETIGVTDGQRSHIDDKKMNIFANYKKVEWDLDKIFEMDKFNVEPVDFNVLYAMNMKALSRLCEKTGDKEGAKLYADRADATKKAIFEKMWDGDKYVDLCGQEGKKSNVKSAAMFYPLMLDGEEHGQHLIEKHLANPDEFNLEHPIPTTSADHPLFDGDQYWRGNVWENVNYFTWRGLDKFTKANPDNEVAEKMKDKIKDSSFELLDKAGFSEYFDPKTGEGHGVQTFGWDGIIKFMEEDQKSGKDPEIK